MYGGSHGVLDSGKLEAALARPFKAIDDQEYYPSPTAKAAAIMESIVNNHAFMDGNKRTGYYLMRAILRFYGLNLIATEVEKIDFSIAVASSQIEFDEMEKWIEAHLA